jgi:iron complex outermembrane recepter protein
MRKTYPPARMTPVTGLVRASALAAVATASLLCLQSAAWAQSETSKFDIPAQPLASALLAYSQQSGVSVGLRSERFDGKAAPAIAGSLRHDEALRTLLRGSGVQFEFVNPQTVRLITPERSSSASSPRGGATPAATAGPAVRAASAAADPGTEEIVVTAQKREQRLIDVPQAVTVLSPARLVANGATQFRDYASNVPGLGFNTTGAGNTAINLRGMAAAQIEIGSRVAQYVDEVPYGASNPFTFGGRFTLDAALSDLDRIEVLRGPQGTLYGASSMGGLIKYTSKKPDTNAFGVDLALGLGTTEAGGTNYNGTVTVNAPISADKAAVRATGFYFRDGGYVDNVALGEKDVNRSKIYGGRVDVLLTPTDRLSLRLTGFAQSIQRNGDATVDYDFNGKPAFGELSQSHSFPDGYDQRLRLISGIATYDMGFATLTSVSSYQEVHTNFVQNYAYLLPTLALPSLGGRIYSALGSQVRSNGDKFVQEVRIANYESRPLEWVVGAFYTQEDFDASQILVPLDLARRPALNDIYTYGLPTRYREYAAFGTLTWHVTDQFDVSAGVRYAYNTQEKSVTGTGILGSRLNDPLRESDEGVATYLANARYKFTDTAMLYARFATGYRAGGPNAVVRDPVTNAELSPSMLESEQLKSYEIGFKGETSDRRFGIDAAAFLLDWTNIQVNTSRGAIGVYLNAAGARVQGGEVTLSARPINGLVLSGAFALTDAKLSEPAPDLRGREGERLPNVARFTASLNADYEFDAAGRPRIGASFRHISSRRASYDADTTNRQYVMPAYRIVDLRGGFSIGDIDLQLYVRNLFDERGQLSAYTYTGRPVVAVSQPRTIGLTAKTSF